MFVRHPIVSKFVVSDPDVSLFGILPRQASTSAWFSGSAAASLASYLLDSMAAVRSSRAIVQYPTWIAKTTSRPRRLLACFAQGSVACGVIRPFSREATSSWTGTYDLFHAQSRTPDAVYAFPRRQHLLRAQLRERDVQHGILPL